MKKELTLILLLLCSLLATAQEKQLQQQAEEAPHVIRLSAQTEGFEEETNLTVVCIDGSVYTYHIRYLPAGETDGHMSSGCRHRPKALKKRRT